MSATRQTIDVEALLRWAIGDQRADLVDKAEISAIGYGYDSLIGLNRLAELGTLVDGGTGHHSFAFYAASQRLSGDAVTVFKAVQACAPAVQLVVLRHARLGTRPDIMADVPDFEPVMVLRKGCWVKKIIYDQSRHPIDVDMIDNRPDKVSARALYATWHRTLALLQITLSQPGVLERHDVTGPAAPAEPWNAPEPEPGPDH